MIYLHIYSTVLFHFSVLYLGLILPKHALLGVSDLFGCILRLDNHSSQFDGLWSGYLDTTFNERPVTWEAWGQMMKKKEHQERDEETIFLVWALILPEWVILGTSLQWPQLQTLHLKWRVVLKSLWGLHLTLWRMLCHVKDLSSITTLQITVWGPQIEWFGSEHLGTLRPIGGTASVLGCGCSHCMQVGGYSHWVPDHV